MPDKTESFVDGDYVDMWDAGVRYRHKCFWCGKDTNSMFWACKRCSSLKEEGYKRAREKGINNRTDVLGEVWDVMEEKGVKSVMPIA